MNVTTITMDKEAAQVKLDAYRQQLRRRADEEYEAAAAGYQALAEGTPLLNLVDVFAETGLGDDGRPKLAIARADRRQVEVEVNRNYLIFNTLRRHLWDYQGSLLINVPFQAPPNSFERGYGLVPMVPADVRPPGNLREFFILWEVESWSDRPLLAKPDIDPFLLRHIGGYLYAVVAAWDLTPLERAVMAGRREG